MNKTKEKSGMTLIALIIAIIVILILIVVAIIEMNRGIFDHTNKYVTETEKSNAEGEQLKNQFIEKYKGYLN